MNYVREQQTLLPSRSQEGFITAPPPPPPRGQELQDTSPHRRKPGLTLLSFYILRLLVLAHYFFTLRLFAYN